MAPNSRTWIFAVLEYLGAHDEMIIIYLVGRDTIKKWVAQITQSDTKVRAGYIFDRNVVMEYL